MKTLFINLALAGFAAFGFSSCSSTPRGGKNYSEVHVDGSGNTVVINQHSVEVAPATSRMIAGGPVNGNVRYPRRISGGGQEWCSENESYHGGRQPIYRRQFITGSTGNVDADLDRMTRQLNTPYRPQVGIVQGYGRRR